MLNQAVSPLALQAKLDELLHAQPSADSALAKIDEKEPEDIGIAG